MSPEETRLREALVWAWTGVNVGVVMVSADDLSAILAEVERLRTRSERLAGALRFYASTNAWRSSTVYMCGHSGPPQAVLDGGQKARRALAQEGEG